MVNLGQAAVGIIVLLVVAGGLLYIFYSRTNAVEKTGYGSLIMLSLVSLLIPIFWIQQASQQTDAKNDQQVLAVQRGMQLYAQYCIDKCYAIKDNKIVDAKYNGYTIAELNQKSDDDLKRIISAGMYNPAVPAPTSANAIVVRDIYGGQLGPDDVDYLSAFIRSADPAYLKKQGFTGDATANGFTQLPDYLQAQVPTQYQAAVSLGNAGQFGNAVDKTADSAVTIDIIQTPPSGATCTPNCFEILNVKVKVGTEITWTNSSDQPHTVTAIQGTNTASPKPAEDIFDSSNGDITKLIPTNGQFKYTVTEAAYNLNPDHTVIYYCRIHPTMLAQLTIVK